MTGLDLLIIFILVAGWDMRHRWDTRHEEKAARVQHRAKRIGKETPDLDPVQRDKAATRAMRGDAAYQATHAFPRLRGDFGDGWRTAKKHHADWVRRTGKKPGLRDTMKIGKKAARERVRAGEPCRDCGTRRRTAWRDDVTKPGWLCRDHWKAAPKASTEERARRHQRPTPPDSGAGDDPKRPPPSDRPTDQGRWRRRPTVADDPGPTRVTAYAGQPVSDPANPPEPPRALDPAPPAAATRQPTNPAGAPGPTKGDSNVSDLMPTGGGLPVPTGDAMGLNAIRRELSAFLAQARQFQLASERLKASAAQAQQHALRLQHAADQLNASMEAIEIDPLTIGEAAEIYAQMELLASATQGVQNSAAFLGTASDGVANATLRTLTGLNARHSNLEEAHKSNPVRAAVREAYED